MNDIAAENLEQARRLARERKPNRIGKRPKPVPVPSPLRPLAHSAGEAARLLGISKSKLYGKIRDGTLRAVKDGRLTLITDAELVRYVETLPTLDLSK